MYSGFPKTHLPLLLCSSDGGALSLIEDGISARGENIITGTLRCKSCNRKYSINEGIVCLLEEALLDKESEHERKLRDQQAEKYDNYYLSEKLSKMNLMEILPTLDALRLSPGQVLLELGCGTGRYTIDIVNACPIGMLLAVDFSAASLRILAQKLKPQSPVGLVQADITRLSVVKQRFDRILSTLVSNLPNQKQRLMMFQLASDALNDNGRFIFSTHYYGIRDRLENLAKSGRYAKGGIYRYYFNKYEVSDEIRHYFRKFSIHPVQIVIPFAQRLGLPIVMLSRIAEHFPFINQLGKLLLATAEKPASPTDTTVYNKRINNIEVKNNYSSIQN